jgi:hypothetical protein
MAKVTLTYTLPDENNQFKLAQRGSEYYCVIVETLNRIRVCLKHGHNFKSADEALEQIREYLSEASIDDIE